MTREEIQEGVRQALAEVLDMDPARIEPGSRLIGDLGADSLDLLDLIFRLEQKFGIKFKAGEMDRRARARLGDVPMEVDGAYTDLALAALREAMPEVPASELAPGLGSASLPKVFRVQTFIHLTEILVLEQR